jgi:hypothetical protein
VPTPVKKVTAVSASLWDRVYVQVKFSQAGVHLNVQHVSTPQEFEGLVHKATKTVTAAKASLNVALAKALGKGGRERPVDRLGAITREDLAGIELPYFGGHKIRISHKRITEFYFYSEELNWKFYDPGFDPEDAFKPRFQKPEFVNDDYAVRTRFTPNGFAGESFKYNLWMRTAVYDNGQEKGHVIIIVDPIMETGEVTV